MRQHTWGRQGGSRQRSQRSRCTHRCQARRRTGRHLDDEDYDTDAEDKAALNDIFVRYLKAILVA